MNEPLHPAQVRALEKLKRLRVGALYIERQDGKLRTVTELARYRLRGGRIDGILWLCTRRRVDLIDEGLHRHAPDLRASIELVGIESLSHRLSRFLELMHRTETERLMLIIDNGLLIKNLSAIRTQRVLALSQRCPYRLLISDVPFTRRISDMYAQWRALDWRILGYSSYWGFCMNHLDAQGTPRNVDYLVRAIEPYCAQILRCDVQPVGHRRELVWQFALPRSAMQEYRRVMELFIWRAPRSSTGVYLLLQACQQVVCGHRVVQDYPLTTAPMYDDPADDPRLFALLEVLEHFHGRRTLILYRYAFEREAILKALGVFFPSKVYGCYPGATQNHRITLMNIFTDEREAARLGADVILYYSNDWNWRKRQEKELQCQSAIPDRTLTVVSLAAADTIDLRILKSIWKKESLIRQLRDELNQSLCGQAAKP